VAVAVENCAGFDHDARTVNFSGDYGAGLNFDFGFRAHRPIKSARNDDAVALDFAFDDRVFAQNQRIFGDESSLHHRVDAERARRLDLAVNFDAALEEARPLGRFLPLAVEPIERHEISLD